MFGWHCATANGALKNNQRANTGQDVNVRAPHLRTEFYSAPSDISESGGCTSPFSAYQSSCNSEQSKVGLPASELLDFA